jgi:H/ACA ribonucleoprotein complex subunit 4
VTGVLPVGLNRACKLNDYFMHRNKVYVGIMRLHGEISEEKLKKEMENFVGKIMQLPPVKSRVKRAERIREVKNFEILEKKGKDVLFFSDVQAGTYIRKLIHDLGEKIGGAHMLELRRTRAGLFDEERIYNLYDLEEAVKEYKDGDETKLREMLVPGEIVSELVPVVQVSGEKENQLLTGKPIMKDDVDGEIKHEKFCVFVGEKFVGIYRKVKEGDIIARPEFVKN